MDKNKNISVEELNSILKETIEAEDERDAQNAALIVRRIMRKLNTERFQVYERDKVKVRVFYWGNVTYSMSQKIKFMMQERGFLGCVEHGADFWKTFIVQIRNTEGYE